MSKKASIYSQEYREDWGREVEEKHSGLKELLWSHGSHTWWGYYLKALLLFEEHHKVYYYLTIFILFILKLLY